MLAKTGFFEVAFRGRWQPEGLTEKIVSKNGPEGPPERWTAASGTDEVAIP